MDGATYLIVFKEDGTADINTAPHGRVTIRGWAWGLTKDGKLDLTHGGGGTGEGSSQIGKMVIEGLWAAKWDGPDHLTASDDHGRSYDLRRRKV